MTMTQTPSKRLNYESIRKAVELLDAWSGKLTWERYLTVLQADLGHKFTKAAMLRHPRIADAWRDAKDRIRGAEEEHGAIGLSIAKKRILELENRIERLQRENAALLEQFLRWSHNAAKRGLTPEELDRPLLQPS